MKTIAVIRTDFQEKFGIPRQSGLANTQGRIYFEPEFQNKDCVRGLSQYSHIWLLWTFSKNQDKPWSATVRPPRLGGNRRVGVFASRSPFRPNSIGLSSVRLDKIEIDPAHGPVLYVTGADILDGTPILDIKPYLVYTDSHADAVCGYADEVYGHALMVDFPPDLLCIVPQPQRGPLLELLSQDPRPSYQNDPVRVYGMAYAGYQIKFTVEGGVLRVCAVTSAQ